MRRLYFDCEANGLLPEVTKAHCLVIRDMDTDEVESYYDDTSVIHATRRGTFRDGIKVLTQASELWGQNIIGYDLPLIEKLYGVHIAPAGGPIKIRDTYVCSQIMWLELKLNDFKHRKNHPEFPGQLIGKHSLEAWGWRLGFHKGDFGKTADWETFTLEMLTYCIQDLDPTKALAELIQSKGYPEKALETEHNFAYVMWLQERHGFRFDRDHAVKLYGTLSQRRDEIERELQGAFPGWYEDMKVPAHYSMTYTPLFTEGPVVEKLATKGACEARRKELKLRNAQVSIEPGPLKQKHTPFNPGSHDHVARFLIEKYGWKPQQFGDDGKPSTTEEILSDLRYPEIPKITEYLMVEKRIGQLAEGDKAWLRLEKDGRVHGRVKVNGAVSTRVTHDNPNMSQVPAVDKPFGKECRACFVADEGQVLVGADASGIQLRALSHYMATWDDGAYGKIVLTGDIHTANQQAAGLKTRDMAKTFIYAFLLGAQAGKVASIAETTRAKGQQLIDNFLQRVPALAHLKAAVTERVNSKGYLVGLDGRLLPTRSAHAALSSLLQGFEAAIMKRATWITYQTLTGRGLIFGKDFAIVGFFHDELQITCRPDLGDDVGKTVVSAIEQAGVEFNSKCPLTGAYRVGANWAATH